MTCYLGDNCKQVSIFGILNKEHCFTSLSFQGGSLTALGNLLTLHHHWSRDWYLHNFFSLFFFKVYISVL